MRIVAGGLGGRTFDSPPGRRTHPMSDKIRGAIFNMLGDVSGLTVLDAFAGSGALGLEAISRGASHVTAIDSDNAAHQTIIGNAEKLGVRKQIKATKANISSWSDNNLTETFDVVLADPPYDKVQVVLLAKLARHAKLGGVIVYSLPPDAGFLAGNDLEQVSSKSYGDATLVICRRIS